MRSGLQIDRQQYLLLAASLAAGGCEPAHPREPSDVAGPRQVAAPPIVQLPGAAEPEPGSLTDREPTSPPPRNCDSKRGDLSACKQLRSPPSPSCEAFSSLQRECSQSADPAVFQPAAAEVFVNCLARISKTSAICSYGAGSSCAKEALLSDAVCIAPSTVGSCKRIFESCERRGARVTFSHDECQQVLSALGDDRRSSDITCVSEACGFAYCLPYSPWSRY